MTDKLSRDIDSFIAENEAAIFQNIARVVAVNSVEGTPVPGKPFGEGPAHALDVGLTIARELGLDAVNCENYIGYAQLGEGDGKYLATITHLDVVPVGDGWTQDPFTMWEKDGYIIGRGVMDDKGPSILCLYALKYLKERSVPLRYPIRALLGTNEETGMLDVDYYLKNYPAPAFCFSPDANFPLCNGEKGIYHGRMIAKVPLQNIVDIKGGLVSNAIADHAEAWIRAEHIEGAGRVTAEQQEPGLWHLTASGIGGHASMPEGTLSAIGVLADFILGGEIPQGRLALKRSLRRQHAGRTGRRRPFPAPDDHRRRHRRRGRPYGADPGQPLSHKHERREDRLHDPRALRRRAGGHG